jgi:FlaG/FlaF family flagellin (archaellin)
MKQSNNQAVSPVIGVMLMLVVVIIIAAVVSAFASGTTGSNSKTPQVTIKGVFSQSEGMQIIHTGGDVIPATNLMFTVANDATFGQGLSSATVQVIDRGIIVDEKGNQLMNPDGTSNVTSFGPGQTLYIKRDNLRCGILQPQVDAGSNVYDITKGGWSIIGTKYNLWSLCFANPDNVGKTFTLTMSDKNTGAVMGRTTVLDAP